MSDLGFVLEEIKGFPAALQPGLIRIFRDVMTNLRFGHPSGEQPDPSTNFGAGYFEGTTPAIANMEFSIDISRFGRAPYLIVPVLPLDQVGAQIVPLKVTRAADNKRVYLSSSVVSAAITVLVEG